MPSPNIMFPGRPNYTGPTSGLFGLLHHDQLCESSDNVMERVAYVQHNKPESEIATRLHNMIYLGGCPAEAKYAKLDADYKAKRDALDADYEAKRDALDADYKAKRAPLDADYEARLVPLDADYKAKRDALYAEILVYIKRHIPDCAWRDGGLVFPAEARG